MVEATTTYDTNCFQNELLNPYLKFKLLLGKGLQNV